MQEDRNWLTCGLVKLNEDEGEKIIGLEGLAVMTFIIG